MERHRVEKAESRLFKISYINGNQYVTKPIILKFQSQEKIKLSYQASRTGIQPCDCHDMTALPFPFLG